MGKRFELDKNLVTDARTTLTYVLTSDELALQLWHLMNELWEESFIASQSVTVTKILSAIVTSNKQVLIPFTLHEKMAMIIKALGGPERAEEFFSELEDSTTIK